MKWNFLYQTTAAPEPLTRGATAPRSPFSLSSVLNWICWNPPTPNKIPGYATGATVPRTVTAPLAIWSPFHCPSPTHCIYNMPQNVRLSVSGPHKAVAIAKMCTEFLCPSLITVHTHTHTHTHTQISYEPMKLRDWRNTFAVLWQMFRGKQKLLLTFGRQYTDSTRQ